MIELITYQKAKLTIDRAEETLKKCFDMLMSIKHPSEALGDSLINFQPILSDCLYELMAFYQELQTEKDYIISQKSIWVEERFKSTIKTNAKYLKVVKEVITIGKSLGDAFAWFFYAKNHQELDKHFEHPSTGLFVAGVGGKGEIEFIKKSQNLDGLFVIYHGITDMLRIGDFSLHANGVGIVGVGELKSQWKDNHIAITANITSKINLKIPSEAITSPLTFEEEIKLLQKSFPSLPKQIEAQDKLMSVQASDYSTNLYSDYEFDVVSNLSKKSPLALNADNSLLLCASWSAHDSLFEILFDDEHADVPNELTNYALNLMKPESPYNEAIISEIDTQMSVSRMPVLWWNISDELCENIYILSELLFQQSLIRQNFYAYL